MRTLGQQILEYRKSEGLTQKDLSELVGVSQSFLSRLERGLRTKISKETWTRLAIGIPDLDDKPLEASELVDTYEVALILIGQGDLDQAEALLQVISDTKTEMTSGILEDVSNKSTIRLAGIRRDQNWLSGSDGAIDLYERIISRTSRSSKLHFESTFMLAACLEMQKNNAAALQQYLELLSDPPDIRTKTRLTSRTGAILTKLGRTAEALTHLRRAKYLALQLPDGAPYSYAQEKFGLALARERKYDLAMDEILGARTEINNPRSLRSVQSRVAQASVLHAAGDIEPSRITALDALTLAQAENFHHQVEYIQRFLKESFNE